MAPSPVAAKPYKEVRDLNEDQKLALLDIWKQAEAMVKGMTMTDTVKEEFLSAIFDNGWTTKDAEPEPPEIVDRKHKQTSVLAGTFKEDLPIKDGAKDSIHRKKGKAAYLKVHVGGAAQSIGWIWTDARGRTVNKAFIELSQSEDELQRKVVLLYDKSEKQRILPYNVDVAIYIARHRILSWSKHGFPVHTPGEDNRFELFKPLILCVQLLAHHRQLINSLEAGVSASQSSMATIQYHPMD
ncbi:hypothetical protein DL765_006444 [Monosporascus sp. GIB2]|nr:hypothetical protein DL765_006444 [Monosporascus sp. GIB2]